MKRRIGTIFLALALCLTLLPVSAFAASTTPKITAIGENEKQSISTSQSGSGWSYDAASTTLTLNGYNGGRIEIDVDAGQEFILKLVGNNTVTANGSDYGLKINSARSGSGTDASSDYMAFTISAENSASLTVDGIYINGKVNFAIGGKADVMSVTTREDVRALQGGDNGNCHVTIQENANVTLTSRNRTTQNSEALVIIKGNLNVNTTGNVTIDASQTGGPAIHVYGGSTFLSQVKEMIIRWSMGGYSLNLKSNITPYAENKGTENGYDTAILHSAPYANVYVKSGKLKYLRLDTSWKKTGKFVKDDVITISADEPEHGKRFTHWTWSWKGTDEITFTEGDATSKTATIKIPDTTLLSSSRDLNFTANYENIPTTGVALNKPSLSLTIDNSEKLTATVAPSDALQNVTWESNNTDVATVEADGTVHAVSVGTAMITATAVVEDENGSKPSAACTVTVNPIVYDITVVDKRGEQQEINSENKDNVLGNGSVKYENLSTAVETKGRLTLTNANLSSTDNSPIYADGIGALEIVLVGENRLYADTVPCIVTNKLIFSGTGSIEIVSKDHPSDSIAIDCHDGITVNGGDIKATGKDYAVHTENAIAVNGGTLTLIAMNTDGEDAVALKSTAKPMVDLGSYGIMLTGTNPDGTGAVVTGPTETDRIKAARYIRIFGKNIPITYDPGAYGVEAEFTVNKAYGKHLTLADASFTRPGYTQTGWAKVDGGEKEYALGAIYEKDETITLYPAWTANQYTVTLDPNGGDSITPSKVTVVYNEDCPTMPVPQYMGYVFNGWFDQQYGGKQYGDKNGLSTAKYDKTADCILYAQWQEALDCTVTFDPNGGTLAGAATSSGKQNAPVSKPDVPTRAGYTFTGWYKDNACTQAWSFSDWMTGDMTLYAGWRANSYTITYDLDGGTAGENSPATHTYGTPTVISAPTRSGYTFAGWLVNGGANAVKALTLGTTDYTSTISLKATWTVISSGGSYTPTYPVNTPSKIENGSVSVSPKNASKGDTVTITVKPDSGYELETITATDKNGNELKLTDKGNGKYTFTMPAGKVDVNATFMEDNSLLNFFYDVPNSTYYYEAVKWAVENGITGGIGNNLFGPEQPCTRAQIVTFLWRAAGSPEPKSVSSFSDVPADSYYAKAVAWAVENGITTGTSTDTFSPDATCTRAQAVTFLARALNAKASGKAEFADVPVDSYFAEAVAWAASNGVTEGVGNGLFAPDNNCTRGQIVTFLWRAYTTK